MVPDVTGFDEAWDAADGIRGWLTRAQGRLLWDRARALGEGATIVEIGSHQGRSTVVLARAAQAVGARVTAIDPFVEGRLFGGRRTRDLFEANTEAAGVRQTVTLLAEYSTRARPGWSDRIDLLYIDGKHDYWTFSDDLRWSAFLAPGGEILVHDSFSSIGVTCGILARVLPSRRYTYLDRAGSLARFVLRPPTWRDRGRLLAQLPWFSRNVVMKVLLRLRLGRVAAVLGHKGPYDPY
jgi:predicted O-methyltransferase YrrM